MNSTNSLFLSLVGLFQIVHLLDGLFLRRNTVLVYKDMIALGNPNYSSHVEASISNTNGLAKASLTINLTRTLDEPVQWMVSIQHMEKGVFVRSFLNADIEACSYFRTAAVNPLFKGIYDNARKYGKLPSRCPIKRDTYFIKDMEFDLTILPQILPSNRLRMVFDIRVGLNGGGFDDVLNFSHQMHFIKKSDTKKNAE